MPEFNLSNILKATGSCPYCKGVDDLNDTDNSDFQLGIHILYENEPRIYINFDNGEYSTDDYSIEINYCPMCGRDLHNEVE